MSLSPDGAYAVFGSSSELDPRFDSDGLFAAYTGVADAFGWLRGPPDGR